MTRIKIFFDRIIIDIDTDPVYYPELGIIVDKSTNQWIYHFNEPEMIPFFYFVLEFDDYKYTNYYLPSTGGYNNRATHRILNIYMFVNINYILHIGNFNKILHNSLQYYFLLIQMKKIKKHKSYDRNINDIAEIINHRNNNSLFIYHWHYLKINNLCFFNLSSKKFISIKTVPKIFFKKTGGIIETNNVPKIVTNILIGSGIFNLNKTLIILPENMSNLWSGYKILTHEQLFLNKKIHNIMNVNTVMNKKILHVIIHECYESFLPMIKLLFDSLECNNIWIINSLPLKYYFSNQLNINKLSSLSNIWFGFNLKNKKIYKTEIIRFLMTNFGKYYFRINCATININHELNLSLSDSETNIMSKFKKKYDNWRNNLINNENNIYSYTTKKQNYKLESKIFNAFICTICSIIPEQDLNVFFAPKLHSTMNTMKNANDMLKNLLNKYKEVNKSLIQKMNTSYIDTNREIIELQNKINKTDSIVNNYTRYSQQNLYSLLTDTSCSVCYDEDDMIKTRLICGHCVCFDCILNTIARYNKCPICNEYITIDKIAIISETIEKYHSELISFLKKIDHSTIILTNIDVLTNLLYHNCHMTIINISDVDIGDKIKKINIVSSVIILTSDFRILSNEEYNSLVKLINYFTLFNLKPKIIKINIKNYHL